MTQATGPVGQQQAYVRKAEVLHLWKKIKATIRSEHLPCEALLHIEFPNDHHTRWFKNCTHAVMGVLEREAVDARSRAWSRLIRTSAKAAEADDTSRKTMSKFMNK